LDRQIGQFGGVPEVVRDGALAALDLAGDLAERLALGAEPEDT
jgi:hypothetical protein